MMEYKGYIGKVEFDDEARIFHGRVVGTRDVITFQGETVAELIQAFHGSVDEYLAFCAERGEEPDKTYSGNFVTRVDPEIHHLISMAATAADQSLNSWVAEQLQAAAESTLRAVGSRKPAKRKRAGAASASADAAEVQSVPTQLTTPNVAAPMAKEGPVQGRRQSRSGKSGAERSVSGKSGAEG